MAKYRGRGGKNTRGSRRTQGSPNASGLETSPAFSAYPVHYTQAYQPLVEYFAPPMGVAEQCAFQDPCQPFGSHQQSFYSASGLPSHSPGSLGPFEPPSQGMNISQTASQGSLSPPRSNHRPSRSTLNRTTQIHDQIRNMNKWLAKPPRNRPSHLNPPSPQDSEQLLQPEEFLEEPAAPLDCPEQMMPHSPPPERAHLDLQSIPYSAFRDAAFAKLGMELPEELVWRILVIRNQHVPSMHFLQIYHVEEIVAYWEENEHINVAAPWPEEWDKQEMERGIFQDLEME